jgi:nicotinamidase-related amidase
VVDFNNDLVMEKRWYSSFFQTTLDDILKSKNINKLFVCGVNTSTCVMATCAEGRHLKYDVALCKEGFKIVLYLCCQLLTNNLKFKKKKKC